MYFRDSEKRGLENLNQLEKITGKKFGDSENPLLVSVRSGARVSMPGMMDTVLNLGLTETVTEGLAKESGDERFSWDSYRRFIQMYADVVLGVNTSLLEIQLEDLKDDLGIKEDYEIPAKDLRGLCVSPTKKQYLKRVEGFSRGSF